MINSIIHADCLDVLKGLDNNSIDLIVTSPPYAMQRANTYGGVPTDDYVAWFKPIAAEIHRVLRPSGSFFLNIKPHVVDGQRSLYVFDLVQMMVRDLRFYFVEEYCWLRTPFPTGTHGRFKNGFEPVYHFTVDHPRNLTFNPLACGTAISDSSKSRAFRANCHTPQNGSGMVVNRDGFKSLDVARPSNVIRANQQLNQYTKKIKHSAPFPEDLVNFFITSFSNEGDTVLDPFAGSGTTGVVARKTNRNYILVDSDIDSINLMHDILNDK